MGWWMGTLSLSPLERIENYRRIIGPAHLAYEAGWLSGHWLIGNSYRKANGYYGGYQGNLLKSVAALFPDRGRVLHLFAGRVATAVFPGGRHARQQPGSQPDLVRRCGDLRGCTTARIQLRAGRSTYRSTPRGTGPHCRTPAWSCERWPPACASVLCCYGSISESRCTGRRSGRRGLRSASPAARTTACGRCSCSDAVWGGGRPPARGVCARARTGRSIEAAGGA